MFPRDGEKQLRLRLSEMLRYVVSQRLAPKVGGGRTLLLEVMGNSLRTKEAVALGEADNRSFYDIITDSFSFGWCTFDQSIVRAYVDGLITEETALIYASRKGIVQREIDQIKKSQGANLDAPTGLRLDGVAAHADEVATKKKSIFGF